MLEKAALAPVPSRVTPTGPSRLTPITDPDGFPLEATRDRFNHSVTV